MAFNFDQFNNSSLVQQNAAARAAEETLIVPSGYVKIRKSDEREIFKKSKMNLSLPSSITSLCVANDWLVTLMSNQLLFRMNLKQPDMQSEVFLEKFITGQRVSNMFLDPSATHLLLALTPKSSGYSSDLMYLNKNSNKPKIVPKVNYLYFLNCCRVFNLFFSFATTKSPPSASTTKTRPSLAREAFSWGLRRV